MPTSVLAVLIGGAILALGLIAAGIVLKRRRGPLLVAATLVVVACVASVAVLNAFATALPSARGVPNPLADTATIYLCSNDATAPNIGQVYAYNARTGAIRWRHPVAGTIFDTTPIVANGVVYVRVADIGPDSASLLVALNASDGGERWRVRYTASQLRSLLVEGDTLFLADTSIDRATLLALRPEDGAALWNVTITSLEAIGSGSRPIAAAGGTVYFTPDGITLVAARERDGAVLWRAQPATAVAPVTDMRADAAGVYLMDSAGNVTALSATTGQVVWRRDINPGGGYADSSELALSHAILYAEVSHPSPDAASSLDALRISDGTVLWRHDLGSPAARPILDGGALDVPAGGNLTVFQAADGTVVRSFDPGQVMPMAALNGVVFGYTRAVYHPFGTLGLFQKSDPHNYLTSLPADGAAPYWRVIAPPLQGSLAIAT